jgi:hypothetical protein
LKSLLERCSIQYIVPAPVKSGNDISLSYYLGDNSVLLSFDPERFVNKLIERTGDLLDTEPYHDAYVWLGHMQDN